MSDVIGILSRDLWKLRREIAAVTGGTPVRAGTGSPLGWSAVAGPGGRRGEAARKVAGLLGVPYRTVATGPLASVRPDRDPPVSLVVEGCPSASPPLPATGFDTVRRFRLAWRNDGRDRLPDGATPDTLAIAPYGRTGASYPGAMPHDERAVTVAEPRPSGGRARPGSGSTAIHPWAALDVVGRAVAARDGDLARLAALAGLPVAGPDGQELFPDRTGLFEATFGAGVTWFDPWSRKPCSFEQAAEGLAWLRDRFVETVPRSYAVGISRWKRNRVALFLDGADGPPVFVGSAEAAVAAASRNGSEVVAWETRMPARLPALCREAGVPLRRMEDGFLRSVGLGSAFLPGASAVLDRQGIYYDPTGPSDLETLLATASFPPELLARAGALRRRVVDLRLSKYNVGRAGALDAIPPGREVVLVPGQVEDDASILLGSRVVRTNLGLLEAARRRHPDAFLVFKPHPDVAAGLRSGAVDLVVAGRIADLVLADAPIAETLERITVVETMTSLAGFEALLRGKRVVVHGRPFYAGWELTEDLDPPDRRGRALPLDALVAAALILYPRYLDPVTGQRCPPEVLVDRLAAARDAALKAGPALPDRRNEIARLRHALLGPFARALRRLRGVRPTRPEREAP